MNAEYLSVTGDAQRKRKLSQGIGNYASRIKLADHASRVTFLGSYEACYQFAGNAKSRGAH